MPQNLVVLDTETGGLDPAEHSILSLSLVPYAAGFPLYLTIAEPRIIATDRALAINHLDPVVLAVHGKTPMLAVETINLYLSSLFGPITKENRIVLVGQNIGFDVGFLKRLYRIAGQEKRYDELFSYRTLDTAAVARFLILAGRLPLTEASGTALGKYFGCPPDIEHNALSDAISTAAVLRSLIRVVQPTWKKLLRLV